MKKTNMETESECQQLTTSTSTIKKTKKCKKLFKPNKINLCNISSISKTPLPLMLKLPISQLKLLELESKMLQSFTLPHWPKTKSKSDLKTLTTLPLKTNLRTPPSTLTRLPKLSGVKLTLPTQQLQSPPTPSLRNP